MSPLILLILVVLIDFRLGDPQGWPHPIIAIGNLIKGLENILRKLKMDNRLGGGLLWVFTTGIVLSVLSLLLKVGSLVHPLVESALIVYLLFASMAATSLKTEAMKVTNALSEGNLDDGRKYLSWLVGRDTESLSEVEVIKGAVETVAENTIDGVIAPLFYIIIGFLIGYPVQLVFLYKTVNTLDSMVGYIQAPYTHIGYVSAKLDDLFNYVPARIGSFIMMLAGGVLGMDQYMGRKVLWRDRRNHKSPNAGYPEAAVAGLLNIQLGGTHTYFGQVLEKPTIGDDIRKPLAKDIEATCKIMYMSEFILLMIGLVVMFLIQGGY